MDSEDIVAYLAFQGGGAKGISHIGGLSAVNKLGLRIDGVAGTSAGAIIAALVAAKYTAKEIFDVENNKHILERLSGGKYADPTHLFTRDGWLSIESAISTQVRIKRIFVGIFCGGKIKKWSISILMALMSLVLIYEVPRFDLVIIAILLAMLLYRLYRINAGLCPLAEVRKVIDEAISSSLGINGGEVTFDCLMKHGGLPLKLVATNVTDSSLELFCYETTPEVVVADAVAASICIPFVFKRWSFEFKRRGETSSVRREFLDGGLMSNLPVWSFDEERALNQRAVTIAFGLNGPAGDGGRNWLISAIDAIVSGPPQIHLRGISRLIYVALDSGVGTLGFDAGLQKYKEDIESAEAAALEAIKFELTEIPAMMRQLLEQMRGDISQKLREKYDFGSDKSASKLIRVALAIQRPTDYISLTVAYEVGHKLPAMTPRVSLADSPLGQAWRQRDIDNPSPSLWEFDGDEDATVGGSVTTQRRIFADSAWMLAVPIPVVEPVPGDEGKDCAVVAIADSPYPLGRISSDEDLLYTFACDLNKFVSQYAKAVDLGRISRRSVSWL